jgi:hypothetical protein
MITTARRRRARAEHSVMCALGARLAAGGELTPAEYDEYLDLSALRHRSPIDRMRERITRHDRR